MIMKWYVYHDDNYYNEGGVGFSTFHTEKEALGFIEERLKIAENTAYRNTEETSLDNYVLIYGKQLIVEAKEYVSRVQVKE